MQCFIYVGISVSHDAPTVTVGTTWLLHDTSLSSRLAYHSHFSAVWDLHFLIEFPSCPLDLKSELGTLFRIDVSSHYVLSESATSRTSPPWTEFYISFLMPEVARRCLSVVFPLRFVFPSCRGCVFLPFFAAPHRVGALPSHARVYLASLTQIFSQSQLCLMEPCRPLDDYFPHKDLFAKPALDDGASSTSLMIQPSGADEEGFESFCWSGSASGARGGCSGFQSYR